MSFLCLFCCKKIKDLEKLALCRVCFNCSKRASAKKGTKCARITLRDDSENALFIRIRTEVLYVVSDYMPISQTWSMPLTVVSLGQNDFGVLEVYPEGQINKMGKTACRILGVKVLITKPTPNPRPHPYKIGPQNRNGFSTKVKNIKMCR